MASLSQPNLMETDKNDIYNNESDYISSFRQTLGSFEIQDKSQRNGLKGDNKVN